MKQKIRLVMPKVYEYKLRKTAYNSLRHQFNYLKNNRQKLYDKPADWIGIQYRWLEIKAGELTANEFRDMMGIYGSVSLMNPDVEKSLISWYRGRSRIMKDQLAEMNLSFFAKNPKIEEYMNNRDKIQLSDFKWAISRTTKSKVIKIFQDQYEKDRYDLWAIQKEINGLDTTLFSMARAKTIAISETGNAFEYGNKIPMIEAQQQWWIIMKMWSTVGDWNVDDICSMNEDEWRIPFDQPHSSWDDEPLAHPNSYHKDTRIMTTNGLKNVWDISVWEDCFTINKETQNIEVKKVINIIRHKEDKLLRLSTNDFELQTTKNHNILYQKSRDTSILRNNYQFCEANKLPPFGRIPRTGKRIWYKTISDDFAMFMGWYLSEWSTTRRKDRPNVWQIKISQNKTNNYKEISSIVDRLWYKYYKAKWYVGMNNELLWKYLIQFWKSFEKYIPNDIKNWTPKIIKSFLNAYCKWDWNEQTKIFDGYITTNRIYTTSSKKMCSDLCELIMKIWKRPSITIQRNKWKSVKHKNWTYIWNHDIFIIRECNGQFTQLSALRKEEIDYKDLVSCVEVEGNNTLYVEYNWKFTRCWNCRCTELYILE